MASIIGNNGSRNEDNGGNKASRWLRRQDQGEIRQDRSGDKQR